jgi:type II secretory pathway pseudopilin PulG
MVVNIVCIGLVLVILVPVWFMTERWLEQQSQTRLSSATKLTDVWLLTSIVRSD